MLFMDKKIARLPLEKLACCHTACELFGRKGQDNLIIRKIYGQDRIRYLRCRACQSEFSERRATPLFNSKIPESKAISIAEHLGEGCGFKSTARLTRTVPGTVRRLNRQLGDHSVAFHDEHVRDVVVDSLQADERHGFVTNKKTPCWEAEVIDPESKFIFAHAQGRRNEQLIRELLERTAEKLLNRHGIVLFTDGLKSYATLFPEIFGVPHSKYRYNNRGRPANKPIYRIPRSLAHVQIIKRRTKKGRLQKVDIVRRYGYQRRVDEALARLQYFTSNTSAIERRNATARRMSAFQVRRTLGFARHSLSKLALGQWTMTVYNWCRGQRMLREPVRLPSDKKKWIKRTPAMALGLANCIMTVEQIVRTPVYSRGGMR